MGNIKMFLIGGLTLVLAILLGSTVTGRGPIRAMQVEAAGGSLDFSRPVVVKMGKDETIITFELTEVPLIAGLSLTRGKEQEEIQYVLERNLVRVVGEQHFLGVDSPDEQTFVFTVKHAGFVEGRKNRLSFGFVSTDEVHVRSLDLKVSKNGSRVVYAPAND